MQTRLFGDIKPTIKDIRNGRIGYDDAPEKVIVDILFKHYREKGFPYYPKRDVRKTVHDLYRADISTLIHNSTIEQSMLGLGLLRSYFPHMWNIPCSGHRTPLDTFNDDLAFRDTLRKVWIWCCKHEGCKVSDNRVRQGLKIYGGSYSVSNFRPTVAKYVYDTYGGDTVYDMSCGFGGRLLGAVASKKVKNYIGCEPATKTFNGLLQLKKDLAFAEKEINIHCIGSEHYRPPEHSVDLAFTSPPYFDTEKYSKEATQSYVAYPSLEEWIERFLKQMLFNAFVALKTNGFLILNIANTAKHNNLETEANEFLKSLNMKHIKTYDIVLSSIAGKGKKTEPMFVYEKIS